MKSFDEDVDYYVPVAEIEKLENQHFDEITKAGLKNGMSQQDRSFASRVMMESQSLRRQAIVQSALEWGKIHVWQAAQPTVQCLQYAAINAQVCLRLLVDNVQFSIS